MAENTFRTPAEPSSTSGSSTSPARSASGGSSSTSAAGNSTSATDAGDLGILFFQHILAKDENEKVRVKLHSGLLRLTMRGWLSVLAGGGAKVVSWMTHKGLKGPSAVASALSRLKKG